MKLVYKNLLTSIFFVVFFVVLLSPVLIYAQNTGEDQDLLPAKETVLVKVKNPIKVSTLNGFIKTLLEGIIKIGIPLIALALIYAGFMLVTATGNPEKIKRGKDAFVYALIGGAILLGSWAIAQMISDTVLQIS